MTLPIFVTEWDETVHSDCTTCSFIMAVQKWTNEWIVKHDDGTFMTFDEIHHLRERVHRLTGVPDGQGNSQAQLIMACQKKWPWLPNFDWRHLTDDQAFQLLKSQSGYGMVLAGNPSQVKNSLSPLRRWTRNDDYGHSIFIDHTHWINGARMAWVMDPLGHPRAAYKGEWVLWSDLMQFAWRHDDHTIEAIWFQEGAAAGKAPYKK